jgi:hypothetical protein
MANISCSFIGRMRGELEGEVEIPLPWKDAAGVRVSLPYFRT